MSQSKKNFRYVNSPGHFFSVKFLFLVLLVPLNEGYAGRKRFVSETFFRLLCRLLKKQMTWQLYLIEHPDFNRESHWFRK